MATPWHQAWRHKLLDPNSLRDNVAAIRSHGHSIATLNGSFDLLHAGHLHILYEAAQQASCLIVALNSDASIRRYKSPDRPIIPLQYRLELIAAIEWVDYVTWFEEDDPRLLLATIKPDVHVNGAEYGVECIEAQVVHDGGGRLHIVELIDGLSTSAIVAKLSGSVAAKV